MQHYVVYFTDDYEKGLNEWSKMNVYDQHVTFSDLKYDWFYMFSVRAIFLNDDLYSPLSRPLFIKTDILDFNPKCTFFVIIQMVVFSSKDYSALRKTAEIDS